MAEEVIPHKRIIALGMLFGQSYIFVHIERDNVLANDTSPRSHSWLDEFAVHAQW
jgi:hypothetical protein